jgi:hypothetical protein
MESRLLAVRAPLFAFQQELAVKVNLAGRRQQSLIEIEVQNETHQTQVGLRFASVPRIGEGLRLRQPDGYWASYDVIDVWYQKAEFGEIWVPYIHVRMTEADQAVVAAASQVLSQKEPQSLRV